MFFSRDRGRFCVLVFAFPSCSARSPHSFPSIPIPTPINSDLETQRRRTTNINQSGAIAKVAKNMTENNPRTVLEELFRAQRFAVLATAQVGEPYASLVAFAVTPDLKGVLFVTSRLTRKYGNLRSDPRAALLVDSRANCVADFQTAVAVTVLGRASELDGAVRQSFLGMFLERHPSMREFAHAPTTSLFRVSVERYVLVDHFQHVVTMDVEPELSC